MSEARRSMPALEVKGLDVYYGHSHALQGVDLTLKRRVLGGRPQWHGQDHPLQGDHGPGARDAAARSACAARSSPG